LDEPHNKVTRTVQQPDVPIKIYQQPKISSGKTLVNEKIKEILFRNPF
jgi:hypothetical protein